MLRTGILILACGLSLPLLAANTNSVNRHAPDKQNKASPVAQAVRQSMAPVVTPHQQARPLTPAERMPQTTSREHLRVDYDRPERSNSRLMSRGLMAAAATCDVNAMASATGSNLVAQIRAASVDGCINTLFSVNGSTAAQLFNEAKMVTVASALRTDSSSYQGNNNTGTLQLILFLRAGYYQQYYNPTDVGNYGTALGNAIRPALDAFVANPHFRDVNDAHGAVLTEFVTLIDSSGENAHQLNTIKGILDRYQASYHNYWYMMSATNNVFTVLFRGHYNADFVSAVQSDSSIATSLSGFVSRNAAEAGTDNEYLLTNAARELARFSQYATLKPTIRPLVKSILDRYSMTGTGASIWVGTADVVDYYDSANCSYYGICNFRTQLAQTVLPVTYQCSAD
ncbi:MAG: M9 family metallopeptidase N-terminal domain-containing protein, partial [Rhodanobacter sp.]